MEPVRDSKDRDRSLLQAFQLVEEMGSLGVWKWDLKSGRLEWSPGMFRLLGLEPHTETPSYALFQSMVHPDDIRSPGEIELIMRETGTIEGEFRIILRDGRLRWILNRGEVFADQTGAPVKAMGIITDVTGLRAAQTYADTTRHYYGALLETTKAAVWTVDADGFLEDLQHWSRLTGQAPADAGGFGWLNAVHTADRKALKHAWDLAFAKGEPLEIECRLLTPAGACRWFRMRTVPMCTKNGSLRKRMCVCIDIEDQKAWSALDKGSTVTGAQLRAARGILNWSVRDLAEAVGTTPAVIRRIEETDGPSAELFTSGETLRERLERAGLEFYFPFTGNPIVRQR